jgi:dTMP kinase
VKRTPNGESEFIAVDGVNGKAVLDAARAELARAPRRRRGGISLWDASGVFGDLVVPGNRAGYPSARTLLLLYAADLAFRLRWEIRPALAEGRVVVAAPYVETAIAFGRAAGLPARWLRDLFAFADRPQLARAVTVPPARRVPDRDGFFEFACERLAARPHGPARNELMARARLYLAE